VIFGRIDMNRILQALPEWIRSRGAHKLAVFGDQRTGFWMRMSPLPQPAPTPHFSGFGIRQWQGGAHPVRQLETDPWVISAESQALCQIARAPPGSENQLRRGVLSMLAATLSPPAECCVGQHATQWGQCGTLGLNSEAKRLRRAALPVGQLG